MSWVPFQTSSRYLLSPVTQTVQSCVVTCHLISKHPHGITCHLSAKHRNAVTCHLISKHPHVITCHLSAKHPNAVTCHLISKHPHVITCLCASSSPDTCSCCWPAHILSVPKRHKSFWVSLLPSNFMKLWMFKFRWNELFPGISLTSRYPWFGLWVQMYSRNDDWYDLF